MVASRKPAEIKNHGADRLCDIFIHPLVAGTVKISPIEQTCLPEKRLRGGNSLRLDIKGIHMTGRTNRFAQESGIMPVSHCGVDDPVSVPDGRRKHIPGQKTGGFQLIAHNKLLCGAGILSGNAEL